MEAIPCSSASHLQPLGLMQFLESDEQVPENEVDRMHIRDNLKAVQVRERPPTARVGLSSALGRRHCVAAALLCECPLPSFTGVASYIQLFTVYVSGSSCGLLKSQSCKTSLTCLQTHAIQNSGQWSHHQRSSELIFITASKRFRLGRKF